MGGRDYYKHGDYNALCYVCGRKRKGSEMRRRWDGVFVCTDDWEPRHPQDFVRGEVENSAPPWTQPEGDDIFIDPANPVKASDL